MGSNYVCLQDIEEYGISNQNGIKEIQDYVEILKKFREMVSFQEEAEVGSLLVEVEEITKQVGRNVRVMASAQVRGET